MREVVISIRDRGNKYSRMSFSSDQVTGTVFSSEHAFPSKFRIYLEHCPRGEAAITGHLHHLKKLPFRSENQTVWSTCKVSSLLLYEPYANESSQICPFLAVRPQFESVHHQNRRLSSHSYSHESVIFWDYYFLSYGEFAFFEFNCMRLRAAVDNAALRLSPLYYDRGQQVAHNGLPHAESIIFKTGRSVAMWTFTGRVFHPAQRPPPVERAPA